MPAHMLKLEPMPAFFESVPVQRVRLPKLQNNFTELRIVLIVQVSLEVLWIHPLCKDG